MKLKHENGCEFFFYEAEVRRIAVDENQMDITTSTGKKIEIKFSTNLKRKAFEKEDSRNLKESEETSTSSTESSFDGVSSISTGEMSFLTRKDTNIVKEVNRSKESIQDLKTKDPMRIRLLESKLADLSLSLQKLNSETNDRLDDHLKEIESFNSKMKEKILESMIESIKEEQRPVNSKLVTQLESLKRMENEIKLLNDSLKEIRKENQASKKDNSEMSKDLLGRIKTSAIETQKSLEVKMKALHSNQDKCEHLLQNLDNKCNTLSTIFDEFRRVNYSQMHQVPMFSPGFPSPYTPLVQVLPTPSESTNTKAKKR